MSNPLRIALIYRDDADNVRIWSGTPYFQKRVVQQYLGEVIDLSPAKISPLVYKIAGRLLHFITGRRVPFDHFTSYSRRLGKYFSQLLMRDQFDLIFVPGCKEAIACLETDIPIIYYSDATWQGVRNYYTVFSNVLPSIDRNADWMERAALRKSAIVLLSSRWAVDSAINDYGVDPANIYELYLGANLMNPPRREEVLPRQIGKTIRLLLVGVNWQIKGGDVALEVLKGLLAKGYDAQLTIIGCSAPEGVGHPRMEVIPFLNKQIPEEQKRFEKEWHDADFFILPSRFEAAGLVFCEASAHAIPILAARTGGIPSIVAEGKNGFTIPHDAEPGAYIEKIIELVNDPDAYAALCERTRNEYETRLNWDTWGERLAEIVAERFPEFRERIGKV